MARFCNSCAASLVAVPEPPREVRKTVTVLFCDVVGSTELGERHDPEVVRALLARYFDRMQKIVESHQGSVEKFIGDAVMAVFGVPAIHEDDALRACRAAVEMREAFVGLGIRGRIGVATGEVVTGTKERLATGDALNVAARLQQAAQPGEILIAEATRVLAGTAVDVAQVEPLMLKGKSERVPAFRLVSARDVAERRHDMTFVGRERELAFVCEAWRQALAARRCELVTVVGEAGLGKSRLVAEALASIPARAAGGRCLPYGTGITYSPVVDVVKQLGMLPSQPAAAAAIRSLLGELDVATSAEEIAWAFRKLLEEQAPTVVVFDDIQWGEETFLDLVEHVVLLSSGAPILVVCMARTELLDIRPSWPVSVHLQPLSSRESDSLIGAAVPEDLRGKIAHAAGGNPLFIAEMLVMAGGADGEVEVPATLKALLAARLDQLDPAQRRVLELGAVEGGVFHRGAVQALGPDEVDVMSHLAALVRGGLIRADNVGLPGEDAFRFRHLLIRDAAYDSLTKGMRVELHSRCAAWLATHGAALVELDEVLGYHLEQACRYRAELDLTPDEPLAAAARRRLTTAGRKASFRQDFTAAVSLLTRASALVPVGDVDVALEIDLVEALFESGKGAEALTRAGSIAERARAGGDRVGELCGRIQEDRFRTLLDPEGATDRLSTIAEQALPIFEAAGDDLALYIGYSALGQVANMRGRWDELLDAYERAAAHARMAGLPYELFRWRAGARFAGTTPVTELLAWLDEQEARGVRDTYIRGFRSRALARLGRFDEARAILAEARAEQADRGAGIGLKAVTGLASVDVELLAGDPAAAAELGEVGCRILDDLGEKGLRSTAAGKLAQALYALDRLDEAEAWATRAGELGASDDAIPQMLSGSVKAEVLARRGEHAEAERLARAAVAIADNTDWLDGQADTYAALAEVLSLAGHAHEAAEALEHALTRYERKGNVVMSQRTRTRLVSLRDSSL